MGDAEDDEEEVVSLMNDLYQSLCSVLHCAQHFVAQQNRLRSEMQSETAKLLQSMEARNIENEKGRDTEIKALIEETRENLKREYGEYNSFCDQKVESIKSECLKYREGVLAETKQKLHDK